MATLEQESWIGLGPEKYSPRLYTSEEVEHHCFLLLVCSSLKHQSKTLSIVFF